MSNKLSTSPVSVAAIFPRARWRWQDMTLLSDRFYLALTVVVVTLLITAAYRWTRFGLLTRATAESQEGAYVTGISPNRIGRCSTGRSAARSPDWPASSSRRSPSVTPSAYGVLFVVPALAAAIVGGFQSPLIAVIAGIANGMVQAWLVFLSGRYSWMPKSGLAEIVPLVVMLVAVLLVTGRAVPVRGTVVRTPLGRAPRPRSLLVPTVVGLAVGAGALILTHGSARVAIITTLIFAIIALSLVVVTGYAGQVSLAQLAIAGVAAFTLSGLTISWGVPFPLAPLVAALVATVVGVLVGLPALRLRGLTLGVVTLALAFGLEAIWFRNAGIVDAAGAKVVSPKLFGLDLGIGGGRDFPRLPFGFMCLIVCAFVAVGVGRLRTSSLGSAMLAVRANERSAAGIGINVTYVKVVSFAIASFIAGLGGALLAYRQGTTTWESFSALGGLALLATAYLAGVTSVKGGLVAGTIAAGGIVYFAVNNLVDIGEWFAIISGVAVIVTLMRHPDGIANAGSLGDRFRAWRARRRSPVEAEAPAEQPELAVVPSVRRPPIQVDDEVPALFVEDLSVHYGGIVAVAGLSLRIPAGRVIGLIGPNGAGKTSAIDAVSGFAEARGAVTLDGDRIDDLPTHRRVRRGLGRTFQSLELYDDLSVEENVRAAAFGAKADDSHEAVARALDIVGIADLRDREAGDLSQGQRQLVSIARSCATDPRVLLLDEPAAGLDTTESRWLGDRILQISATGVGVMLVDHDVALVLGICDYVYVLDFGLLIAEGTPTEIRANRAVAGAYLGNAHANAAVTA